jgi:hypothetical protein
MFRTVRIPRAYRHILLVITMATAVSATAQVETIDARARGTSTQMGKQFDVKVIINQFSTAQDRETLKDAFTKGGQDALVSALSKMKGVGRLRLPSTVGYSIAYARSIPTPSGRKIRFVTDRPIAIGEQRNMTRSESYGLTAGEIDINEQDKSKSTGVLYPAAQLVINKEGELQFELFKNPWQLANITDWKGKGKD